MTTITACIAGPIEWEVINNQFYHETHYRVYNPEVSARVAAGKDQVHTPEEKRALERSAQEEASKILHDANMKALGYHGMDYDEIETAIKEKYAGKNTVSDFLDMQSELKQSGVLRHKMGEDQADTYCAMLEIQLETAYNPDYAKKVGAGDIILHISTDQWYRVADQPFDTAQFAASMKKNLHQVSGLNGWTKDYVKMMEGFFDHFITGAVDDSLDALLSETNE